uniref:Ig-like domain-containing protein n=1 Tax=Tetranychus urticae TaxID=32264 RepID=T1KII3_TETUR
MCPCSPGIQIKTINQFDDVTVLNRFTASSGSRVELPCDLTIPSAEDSISLILWYKNDRKSPPIYSVDARNSPVEKASHFTADEFKNRAKFNLSVRPGLLSIEPVHQEDTGLYLCRVDFKWARTVNTLNNLTVIEPAPTLESCSISNQTSTSFQIECYNLYSLVTTSDDKVDKTYRNNNVTHGLVKPDESLPLPVDHTTQSSHLINNKINYFLEVYSSDVKDKIVKNLTSNGAKFTVNGLQPDTSYLIHAYSGNQYATSLPIIIPTRTLRPMKHDPPVSLEFCSISNKTISSFVVNCFVRVEQALGDESNSSVRLHQNKSGNNFNDNKTDGSFESSSVAANSGSSKANRFHVEIFNEKSKRLTDNLTNSSPFFSVSGLEPGNSYTLYAYTSNYISKSSPLTVKVDLPLAQVPTVPALEPIIPLESCVISNQTVDSFLIECSLKQLTSLNMNVSSQSSLTVYHSERNELIINQTRPKPQFLITGLEPETSYLIYAYTANLHTKSDPIKLTVKTVHPAQPKQDEPQLSSVPLQSCSITNQTWGSFIVECIAGTFSPETNHSLPDSNSHLPSLPSSYLSTLNPNVHHTLYPSLHNSWPNTTSLREENLSSTTEPSVDTFALKSFSSSNNSHSMNSHYAQNKYIYHLEVFNREKDKLLYNMTNSSPIFAVSGLEPSTSYLLYIYTSNKNGLRSSSLTLKSGTLTMMNRKQDYVEGGVEVLDSRVLILVLGASCLLLLLALVILIIMKIRKRDAMISNRKRSDLSDSSYPMDTHQPHQQSVNKGYPHRASGPEASPGCLTSLTHLNSVHNASPTVHSLDNVFGLTSDTLKDKLKGGLGLTSTFTGLMDGLTLRSDNVNSQMSTERNNNQNNYMSNNNNNNNSSSNGSNKSFSPSENNNPLAIDVDHQQPKWILVNSTTNPDVIPTKANLPEGNSGSCSNLVNSRLLDGCPINSPLSGTLLRSGQVSIKVDPNVLNGAYNVPHVRLISNRANQPQLILTPQNSQPPEISIFSTETFEEPNIVSFSTAV